MALTDHCDVFASVHEDGFNRLVVHIGRQRPSLFNYGTSFFATHPERLCRRLDVHPEVIRRGNPLISVEDPLPIPGTGGAYGLDFCLQLTALNVDFHPSGVFQLPNELGNQLKPKAFAFRAEFCAGLGCPSSKTTPQYEVPELPPTTTTNKDPREDRKPRLPPTAIPWGEINCFCIQVFAVLHAERVGDRVGFVLDGLEIVDISPVGLESALECYIATTLRVALLPKLRITMNTLALEMGNFITITPTPISANVPDNPAVGNNTVAVFLSV